MSESNLSFKPSLRTLDPTMPHEFAVPSKRINEGEDMSTFLVSKAYRDILAFLMQLNHAMFPSNLQEQAESGENKIKTFNLHDSSMQFSTSIVKLQEILQALDQINEEVELDQGPRRFGNIAFRKWHSLLETRTMDLLKDKLPASLNSFKHDAGVEPLEEIRSYLLGSFGSAQRLDYGTGHELSFLAFLGCIIKLEGFGVSPGEDTLRQLVLGVIHPYLELARKLILRFSLEPAGSHGVWGLDDHSFLPYIFGSAQYGPAIREEDPIPVEGSLQGVPNPGDIVKTHIVDRERKKNLYFGAIGFIYDVKTGPFWEHSPTLYDISGVRAGWGKINKGMMKMYDAEVLGKFPVVQHFPFGSLFSFERDPDARVPDATVHTSSQSSRHGQPPSSQNALPPVGQPQKMQAPWGQQGMSAQPSGTTQAPWAARSQPPSTVAGLMPQAAKQSNARQGEQTKAPWAK